jgi:uncharacterized protein
VTDVHRLTLQDARRIAVSAQLLDAHRPTDFMDVVRHLAAVQVDGTKAVAPSADLVLWSRLGPSDSTAHLAAALAEHRVVDLRGILRPADDVALYRAEMASWPGEHDVPAFRQRQSDWLDANAGCRRDILRRLRDEGPLTSKQIPDSCSTPWASSGWNNNKNVGMLLEFMGQRGEVAIAGHRGRDRVWDLAERVYPTAPVVPAAEANRIRAWRRLRALGIARARTTETPVEPNDVGDTGIAAVVEEVRGEWRVDPDALDALGRPFEGRAALLSPLDRLVYDRTRMVELFGFDYALEMYKPATERKWGYFALPILFGDRLVGKLDATADKKRRSLRVDAVHEDERFTKQVAAAVDHEIDQLRIWIEREEFGR